MIYLDDDFMKEVLFWDNFFNDKENYNSSPYFMLKNDLRQKNTNSQK